MFGIDDAVIASAVGAGLMYGADWLNTGYGIFNSNRNFDSQKSNLDYQKALQLRQWQREDTAISRRMADAQKAGVNPYAVVGGGASSSVVSTTAPQHEAVDFSSSNPIGSMLDMRLAVEQIRQAKEMTEQAKEATKQAKTKTNLLSIDEKEREIDSKYFDSNAALNSNYLDFVTQNAKFNKLNAEMQSNFYRFNSEIGMPIGWSSNSWDEFLGSNFYKLMNANVVNGVNQAEMAKKANDWYVANQVFDMANTAANTGINIYKGVKSPVIQPKFQNSVTESWTKGGHTYTQNYKY